MISRFKGIAGRERLISALRQQELVGDNVGLAEQIADVAKVVDFQPNCPGSTLIQQGAGDNDIYFLLLGEVVILVNGKEVATRAGGTHVGEMALVDSTSPRSASVVATSPVVAARVTEPDFTRIANGHPDMWRKIAVALTKRLHDRGRMLRPQNERPRIFIGSSTEGLAIAKAMQTGLAGDSFDVQVWTDGIFRASRTFIESMIAAVEAADFGALIWTPDDVVASRGVENFAPRDNCILEIGLFIGALGRDRSFIVQPRGADIKWPSDLLGVAPLEFEPGDTYTLDSRIDPVCGELRKLINDLGLR